MSNYSFVCVCTCVWIEESPPRVGWMKRTMNNMQVSKQVLQNYSDVVENDSMIADIEETINDILSKNKRTEAVSVQLLTAVNKSKSESMFDATIQYIYTCTLFYVVQYNSMSCLMFSLLMLSLCD